MTNKLPPGPATPPVPTLDAWSSLVILMKKAAVGAARATMTATAEHIETPEGAELKSALTAANAASMGAIGKLVKDAAKVVNEFDPDSK